MSEILPSGQYFIRCEDVFAGRNFVEDRSGNPKRVYCPADRPGPQVWEIERLDNGHYKLKARGAPVGTIDNLLYALLIHQERADEWIITLRPTPGPRPVYTIERASDRLGWIKSTNVEEPQIAVRHLIMLPIEPPQFIPTELWNIQPLVDWSFLKRIWTV